MLSATGTGGATVTDTSATATIALRNACHNILYGLAQTNMIDWEVTTPGWVKLVIGIDIAAAVLVVAAEALLVTNWRKNKTKEQSA